MPRNETPTTGGTTPVNVQADDGVATISIDRQERHNSFDVDTAHALHAAVQAAAADDAVHAIIITGQGRAFCTGADLQDMQAQAHRASAHLDDLTRASHAFVEAVRHAPKPVVAAVNGVAAGGGVGIALAADLVVMAESARFVLAFANLGLSPDCGATAALTHTLGVYRAREAIFIDGGISAAQAHAWGLANRVAPNADVLPVAADLARLAGARSRHSVQATKELIQLARHSALESSLAAERRAIIQGAATPDFQEGIAAFHEKRPPRFQRASRTDAPEETR